MQRRDNYDVLYVVERFGKPIKVGLRGQNAYARKKDAEAIITRLVGGRWPYGLKKGDREEFQIKRYLPAGAEPQYSKVRIKAEGATAHDSYVEIDGHTIANLRSAELSIRAGEINKIYLEKLIMKDADVDIYADVESKFVLPEDKEEAKILYNQLIDEFGEELKDA